MRVNIKTEMGCPMKFYLTRKTNVGLMKKLISKKCESHSGFLCQQMEDGKQNGKSMYTETACKKRFPDDPKNECMQLFLEDEY